MERPTSIEILRLKGQLKGRSIMTGRMDGLAILALLLSVSLFLGGCITDATIELTKAPFDATSDISDGVSNATSEFTEPTKELTSSTTPGAWFTEDGPVKAEHKLRAFAVYSFYSLKSDVAQGRGEFLISFAELLGIPQDQRPAFFEHMQAQYAALYAEPLTPAESLNLILAEAQRARGGLDQANRS
jgi:hypothetical protein